MGIFDLVNEQAERDRAAKELTGGLPPLLKRPDAEVISNRKPKGVKVTMRPDEADKLVNMIAENKALTPGSKPVTQTRIQKAFHMSEHEALEAYRRFIKRRNGQ